MHRRRQKIKKEIIEGIIKVYKKGNNFFCNNQDTYGDVTDIKPIYMINQFFIPSDEKRYKELKFCLQKNVSNKNIEKIYLLNERIYSPEELGIDNDKIIQINIEKRLTFEKAFDFARGLQESYCLLCNSDIFLDESVKNLQRGNLANKASLQALLRYEFKEDVPLEEATIFGPRKDSQDTWIVYNTFLHNLDLSIMNFPLGKGGCDNAIVERFHRLGFAIYNEPDMIKTYHYHYEKEHEKKWHKEARVEMPYLYPNPIIKRLIKNEKTS